MEYLIVFSVAAMMIVNIRMDHSAAACETHNKGGGGGGGGGGGKKKGEGLRRFWLS